MKYFDSLFTPNVLLNEEIASEVFENMPERPLVFLTDARGSTWSNDQELLERFAAESEWLADICGRISDGAEPLISNRNGWGVIVSAVATAGTRCGYLFVCLERHSPEATLAKLDLAEALIHQVNQVAKLVEEGRKLRNLNMKVMSVN